MRRAWLPSPMARLRWNVRPAPILAVTFLKVGIGLPKTSGTYTSCRSLRLSKYLPRWLYSYFLAVDTNFRLKLKSRGIADPEIGSGWSYFVESKQYHQHVSQKTTDIEVGLFGFSVPIITLILVGHWVQFKFPCCEPGQYKVLEGLHCLRRGCLCMRSTLVHAKEWGW